MDMLYFCDKGLHCNYGSFVEIELWLLVGFFFQMMVVIVESEVNIKETEKTLDFLPIIHI